MPKIGQHAVYLAGEGGKLHEFLPGDDVPKWAADQMGVHCFAKPKHRKDEAGTDLRHAPELEFDTEPALETDPAPPLSGPGGSRMAWESYARAHGVELEEGLTRDGIVEACREAGIEL